MQATSKAASRHIQERNEERRRRDLLRAARDAVWNTGIEAILRLHRTPVKGVFLMSVPEIVGIDSNRLSSRLGSAASGITEEEVIATALRLADLHDIARRRNLAVRDAGGDPRSPPAWAFIGHPVIRGVIAALTPSPADYRPLDSTRWQQGVKLSATRHDMRLGHKGVRLTHNGMSMLIDAGNQMARIQLKGQWPDTIVDALPGKPLSEVLGLPEMEAGTPAGDSLIRDAWQDGDHLGFTVSCRLVPLASAPDGVDTRWLDDWVERHIH